MLLDPSSINFFKSVGISEALKENLHDKQIKIAFIYGSYARGEESLLSDIDLMIIGDISSKELSGIRIIYYFTRLKHTLYKKEMI